MPGFIVARLVFGDLLKLNEKMVAIGFDEKTLDFD